MDLPIDVVPNTNPPRFRWRQLVSSPIGMHNAQHEGVLQPSVEQAVLSLIILARQQAAEIENLQRINAAQSEVITKKAEVPVKKGKTV